MNMGVTRDAIMFLDDNTVVKEMLYPEFEAVLDHVVGIDDFKNTRTTAVYLRINPRLKIVAAVFFVIEFDDRGYTDKNWNVPLQHLADHAGRGPDLGAGPIKLSCRSQCSVSWHQRSLWDPQLDAGSSNTLSVLGSAVVRNRLGLIVEKEPEFEQPEAPTKVDSKNNDNSGRLAEAYKEQLKQKYKQEFKTRSTALAEEQKLRIATIKSDTQDYIEKMQRQYQAKLQQVESALASAKQLFTEEKHKNLQLKKAFEEKAEDLHQQRESFQQKIEKNKEFEQVQFLELEEKFEQEAKAKLDAATTELKERLDMREVELFYRDEQIGRLNQEVSQLRQEKQNLIDGSGDRVLQRLVESGITFVAYQPGVDHMTIPLREMSQYLESPLSYVAEKCSVDEAHYRSWIAHFEFPACNYIDSDGNNCGKPIPKIEKPSRFISGESDRCSKHSRASNALNAMLKVREST